MTQAALLAAAAPSNAYAEQEQSERAGAHLVVDRLALQELLARAGGHHVLDAHMEALVDDAAIDLRGWAGGGGGVAMSPRSRLTGMHADTRACGQQQSRVAAAAAAG